MASTSMKKDVELAQAWAGGEVAWEDLPPHVQDAIDEVMSEQLPDEAAVSDAMTKSDEPLELLHKADDEHRFTLGPWYIPNRYDAHGEWTDADELQKALWEYVKSGDRDIRLQHNKDIVAGEWLEAMSFPVPVTIGMNKAEGSQQVTYPSGTVFLGVQWKPWAWELVKEGKIRGFSIGGAAARIEMAMPDDAIAKASFGGDRSAAGRYAAEQRWKGNVKSDKPDASGRVATIKSTLTHSIEQARTRITKVLASDNLTKNFGDKVDENMIADATKRVQDTVDAIDTVAKEINELLDSMANSDKRTMLRSSSAIEKAIAKVGALERKLHKQIYTVDPTSFLNPANPFDDGKPKRKGGSVQKPNPKTPSGKIAAAQWTVMYALSTELKTVKHQVDALTQDRKSTRLNSSHVSESRMPSSA